MDIRYFLTQVQQINDHRPFSCNFNDMEFITEKQIGLISSFIFKCKLCNIVKSIATEDVDDQKKMNMNVATVFGAISTGIGHTQLQEQQGILDMPRMSYRQYSKCHEQVSDIIYKTLYNELLEAGKEELKLAQEVGDVDADGNGLITVIADGAWSKRSYNVSYDALSGVVRILSTLRFIDNYLLYSDSGCRLVLWAQKQESYCT